MSHRFLTLHHFTFNQKVYSSTPYHRSFVEYAHFKFMDKSDARFLQFDFEGPFINSLPNTVSQLHAYLKRHPIIEPVSSLRGYSLFI